MTAGRALSTLVGAWFLFSGCASPPPPDGVVRKDDVRLGASRVSHSEGYTTPDATRVQLWYERFGSSDVPAVVLLNGNDAPATLWERDFLAPLLDAGYQVIRFDARDCGRSEWLPWPRGFEPEDWTPEKPPPYPLRAHVSDLFGLLDSLGIEDAHLVGLSQGGMIAQMAAIEEARRVISLALLSTSPSNSYDPELETIDPELLLGLIDGQRRLGRRAMLPPVSRKLLARELTRFYLEVSSARPSDEAAIRALVDRSLEHARYNAKSAQGFAVAAAPSRVADLHRISAPTLILHGHRDAFFPYSHAVLLAERIPHARLIGIPGAGHALPLQRFYPYLADIVDHIDRAQRIRGSAAAQRAEVLVEANP